MEEVVKEHRAAECDRIDDQGPDTEAAAGQSELEDQGLLTSRWGRLKNGLSQGSVLAPLLFNIYTIDQPTMEGTYKLSKVLNELTSYYKANHLHANPSKTQVIVFHLGNHQAKRHLQVTWSGIALENCEYPVYLGTTIDHSL
uniref:Reverse transcriptase domain-containing protein n=1 Tax=Stegastes partitus TaxID=144197 RepID=A0A3B5AHG5_9TELE